ncbi:hypothetical protein [Xenophilus sp. Marseille-Q4582]|uniref:hypothetical protein n=1 Tax=Xenophilus sp. Marseille-Q4582 TaxID=2866600 RepID=UPI001CE4546D|nr:hypothetical protein [Xenophilus sp. Marseille-Q4582]
MDLFGTATLRHPTWYSDSVFEERALPLSVGDYKVTPGVGRDGRWTVTDSKGATVYSGIGPVTVVPA